jgi:hypothetical protein
MKLLHIDSSVSGIGSASRALNMNAMFSNQAAARAVLHRTRGLYRQPTRG